MRPEHAQGTAVVAMWIFILAGASAITNFQTAEPGPLFAVFVIVAVAAFSAGISLRSFVSRWERRWYAGLCTRCGYDRHGLAPDAKCPECGAVPTTPTGA